MVYNLAKQEFLFQQKATVVLGGIATERRAIVTECRQYQDLGSSLGATRHRNWRLQP